jgi:predicted Zn finger-like uncharacterized protein
MKATHACRLSAGISRLVAHIATETVSMRHRENFFCPHCGALYAVTHSRVSESDSNIAKCVVCGHTMEKRESTTVPIYNLVHRPEDA